MRIAGELRHSFVNGPGTRYVVFFQGCPHRCSGCHNPETHDPRGGIECSSGDIIGRIAATKLLDGVTLTGGDPFLQPEACSEIAQAAKEMGLNVWAYTGWRFEDLVSGMARMALKYIDVLVDGRYIEPLHSDDCLWRGSTNQRLIDVQQSLSLGTAITIQ